MIDAETRRRDTAESIWYGSLEEAGDARAVKIARTMLADQVDTETISNYTGLPLAEILKLQAGEFSQERAWSS